MENIILEQQSNLGYPMKQKTFKNIKLNDFFYIVNINNYKIEKKQLEGFVYGFNKIGFAWIKDVNDNLSFFSDYLFEASYVNNTKLYYINLECGNYSDDDLNLTKSLPVEYSSNIRVYFDKSYVEDFINKKINKLYENINQKKELLKNL